MNNLNLISIRHTQQHIRVRLSRQKHIWTRVLSNIRYVMVKEDTIVIVGRLMNVGHTRRADRPHSIA